MDERERDKYNFRYPSGESYSDIVARLLPLLSSLQKLLSSPSFLPPAPTEAVLIVGHQAVLRCLIAMLKRDVGVEEVPYVKVPLHTLMRLEWGSDALPVEKRWKLDVPGADTHREAQAKRKEPEEAEAANVIFALTPPSTETLVTGSTAAIAPSNEEETEDLLEIPQRPRGRSFSKFVMGDSH